MAKLNEFDDSILSKSNRKMYLTAVFSVLGTLK